MADLTQERKHFDKMLEEQRKKYGDNQFEPEAYNPEDLLWTGWLMHREYARDH